MPRKQSTPKKPTTPGQLFTLVDNDNLEVYTNLSEEVIHSTIREVLDGEHATIEDAEMLTIINQTTGIPYTIEATVEYTLVVDNSQPQYRKPKEQ